MSLPAACVGDLTATGDPITGPGIPTVLIAGKPASVMGDLVSGTVCAGAISAGCSTTVLIGGRGAARSTTTVTGANVTSGAPVTTAVIGTAATVLIGG